MIGQIFGTGNPSAPHNDFLRSLLSGGVIGLMIYVVLLHVIGMRVFKNYLRERSPLNVMALMIFGMWLIDTIGLSIKGINFNESRQEPSAPGYRIPKGHA